MRSIFENVYLFLQAKQNQVRKNWIPDYESREALRRIGTTEWYDQSGDLCTKVVPATGNAVGMAFGRIKKLAGLEHIRVHDMRHESISRFHELGLTIPGIMR